MSQAVTVARAVVAALIGAGVKTVVLAPGSRSAPLAYALFDSDLQVIVRIDERAAAFTALGAALASGEVTAVVTTSGTAVANLHPALAEADAAGVPLLAITADRPRELWGTGANQTTHQLGMFTTVVRKIVQIDPHEPRAGQLVAEAVSAARGGGRGAGNLPAAPGPVHVNISFTPPLHPCGGQQYSCPPSAAPSTPAASSGMQSQALAGFLRQLPNPVVVAGDKADRMASLVPALVAAGVPVLAEPTSGLRHLPQAIANYHARLAQLQHHIGAVVVAGHPTLTRDITALISRTDLPQWVLTNSDQYVHLATNARPLHVADTLTATTGLAPAHTSAWLAAWREDTAACAPEAGSLAAAALQVWQASTNTTLVVGASSTIRALDRYAPTGQPTPRAYANRGLAGIDGTLATAWGIAVSRGEPVRVLCGDLTFLHDASALNAGVGEEIPDLQIIVLDDAGGSIFQLLEHGELARKDAHAAARFARFFATAQRSDIAAVARGFGAKVSVVNRAEELAAALAAPVRAVSVVHVKVSSQHSGS